MDRSTISTIYGLAMKSVDKSPTWYIAGIGAMGGLLANRFTYAGHKVNLLLKSEAQLLTYQQSKLTVMTENSEFSCHPPAIDIEHLNNTCIHYLICCVKAYDVTKLLLRLAPHLNEKSIIILIHNGLGVIDEIKAQLPKLRIISGSSTIGAYLESPFTIRAFLDGNLYLGDSVGQFKGEQIETIRTTFQAAKLPFQWEEDIGTMLWEKFALNCSVNILTALLTCKNGDLLHHIDLLRQITHEIAQVVNAFDHSMSTEQLFLKVTRLLQSVGNNYSSMYKDVRNNRKTELRYLNEHLIALAQQKKIATPFNIELLKQFYAKYPV